MAKQLCVAVGLWVFCLHAADAANFSFTGNLSSPDDRASFGFGVDAQSQVVLRTLSYAGGVNAAGQTIPSGGFDTVVTLFDSNGTFISDDDDGRGVYDPDTGSAYDSELMALVSPGDYVTVVSVFPNFYDDSTGEWYGATDFDGRTSFYALDILNVARAQAEGTSTTENASSNVTSSTLVTQTAAVEPNIVGQRVVGQVFRRQLKARQATTARILDVPFGSQGAAAGEGEEAPLSGWVSYQHSTVDNDFVSTAFDSHTDVLIGGADILKGDFLLGVGLGYEQQKATTYFNGGSQKNDNYTVVPYLGYLITDWLSADVSVGYTRIDTDQSRTLGFLTMESSPDSLRWFGSANLNAVRTSGNWLLSGVAGALYVYERQRPFTETAAGLPTVTTQNSARSVHVGQVRIGGGLSYLFKGWEPFVNLDYVYDFSRTEVSVGPGQPEPSNDDDEFRLGMGIRYLNEAHGVSASLEYVTVQSRANIDSNSVSLTMRIDL